MTCRTRLVGRQRELRRLRRLVADGQRVITITGPPGVGKSRLAAAWRASTPCSTAGCDVTSATSTLDVIASVSGALGGYVEDLGAALAARGALVVVIDNVEHHADTLAVLIERWLDAAPQLQIVATSQLPLNVNGQTSLPVAPLSAADATTLFCDRARLVAPDLDVRRDDPRLQQLVDRLDRLPLAIELAAARSVAFSPAQLLDRFPGEALAATVTSGLRLATDCERTALSHCATFAGAFSLEAAEAVVAVDGRVDDVLETLVRRSLVEVTEHAGRRRFRMYHCVREFVEADFASVERHAHYFATQAMQRAALELAAELDELLAVCRNSRLPAGWVVPVAAAVQELLSVRGPAALALEVLDLALERARADGDDCLAARTLIRRGNLYWELGQPSHAERDLARGARLAGADPHARTEAQVGLGRVRAERGEHAGATEVLSRALDEAPTARLRAHACYALSLACDSVGDKSTARDYAERARALYADAGDRTGEAEALSFLGSLDHEAGMADLAQHHLELAASYHEAIGGRYLAATLQRLGLVLHDQNRSDDALAVYQRAAQICARSGLRVIGARVRNNMGLVLYERGDLDGAAAAFRECVDIHGRCGNERAMAIALENYAAVLFEQEKSRQARTALERAVAICKRLRLRTIGASALIWLAAVEAAVGSIADAEAHFAEASAHLDPFEATTGALLWAYIQVAKANQCADRDHAALLLAAAARTADDSDTAGEPLTTSARVALKYLRNALTGSASSPRVQIGRDGAWFSVAGGAPIRLGRRRALRRLLHAVATEAANPDTVGVSTQTLIQVGWPGESMTDSSALRRLYQAIHTLRKLGLQPFLHTTADGYGLRGCVVEYARGDDCEPPWER